MGIQNRTRNNSGINTSLNSQTPICPERGVPFLIGGNVLKMDRWKLKKELLNEYGCICSYCGGSFEEKDMVLEHYITESKGGKTDHNNCVLSCSKCNSSKGGLYPRQWLINNINKREIARAIFEYRSSIVENLIKIINDREEVEV